MSLPNYLRQMMTKRTRAHSKEAKLKAAEATQGIKFVRVARATAEEILNAM
jgi:hypothetical protein